MFWAAIVYALLITVFLLVWLCLPLALSVGSSMTESVKALAAARQVQAEFDQAAHRMQLTVGPVQYSVPTLGPLGFSPTHWSFDPASGIAIIQLMAPKTGGQASLYKTFFLAEEALASSQRSLQLLYERRDLGLEMLEAPWFNEIATGRSEHKLSFGERHHVLLRDSVNGAVYLMGSTGLYANQGVMVVHRLRVLKRRSQVVTASSVALLPALSSPQQPWVGFVQHGFMYFVQALSPTLEVARISLGALMDQRLALSYMNLVAPVRTATVEPWSSTTVLHPTLLAQTWRPSCNPIAWSDSEWLLCVRGEKKDTYVFATISRGKDAPFEVRRATPPFRFTTSTRCTCRDIWLDRSTLHCAVCIPGEGKLFECRFPKQAIEALLTGQ